jgi:hypothetical protein
MTLTPGFNFIKLFFFVADASANKLLASPVSLVYYFQVRLALPANSRLGLTIGFCQERH